MDGSLRWHDGNIANVAITAVDGETLVGIPE